jgi:hypothetical protein
MEFENALAAAFGASAAEPPVLAIDQLDGRLVSAPGAETARASTCVTRAEPVRVTGLCGGNHPEPVRVTGLCGGHHAEPVMATVCRAEPGTCYCRAEPVLAQA